MKKIIFIASLLISMTAAANSDTTKVKQCKGIAATGQPCKSTFIPNGADYCNSHNPAAVKCSGTNSKKKQCGNKVAKSGDYCRFHK